MRNEFTPLDETQAVPAVIPQMPLLAPPIDRSPTSAQATADATDGVEANFLPALPLIASTIASLF